ncbi:hypothetical protein IFM89_005911 [Coptis chinensis]|uniref:RING-type domain-containing protein n=1 Tax=Coptis chinensis TaxID=261450 RepID=A0A835LR22_9MAGN|nr:hypothetical protein IFM89_005911 [Coptis chinensis]
MSTDSIVFAFSKESSKDNFGKKKRTNRSAKLKQCKLDARREQWLSQVKNKGCKEEMNGGGGSSSSMSSCLPGNSLGNLEMMTRGKDIDSDFESSVNSSSNSISGSHDLGKDSVGSSFGSRSSSVSGGCSYQSGVEEEEEEEDECADDWEAVADALTADDKQKNQENLNSSVLAALDVPAASSDGNLPKTNSEVGGLKLQSDGSARKVVGKGHAWKPDDAFRPQSLPTLSKQYSFPMNAERCCGRGASNWVCHSVVSQPTSCPICYEELDLTDSSFLPCLCGFRLCLFCHKRILEADGRCPGCRKHYESAKGETVVNGGTPPFRFTRSFSMSTSS